MWYERLLFGPSRIPSLVIWFVSALAMAVTAHAFVNDWAQVTLAYIPLLGLLEAISRSSHLAGLAYAKRVTFTIMLFTICMILLVVVLFTLDQPTSSVLKADVLPLGGSYLIIGLILGTFFRHSFSKLLFFTIFGRTRLHFNILMLAIWTTILIIYPWSGHNTSAPWYIVGIGIGVLVEKGSASRVAKVAAAHRRLQDVVGAWPPDADAKEDELTALRLLARGRQFPSMRFSKLRNLLELVRKRGEFSKRLALISASVHRLEGDYLEAIKEVGRVVNQINAPVDAHLTLLKILSLAELDRESEIQEEFQNLFSSTDGDNCPIGNAINALMTAETQLVTTAEDLDDLRSVEPDSKALDQMLRAMKLRLLVLRERYRKAEDDQSSVSTFLSKFSEVGVPVTPSLMIDIMGYCLLAAGHSEEARIHFRQSIEMDPAFSPSYLHLGEYFLFRRFLTSSTFKHEYSDLWHATACYHAAISVELNKSSKVRRMAERRIRLVRLLSRLPKSDEHSTTTREN